MSESNNNELPWEATRWLRALGFSQENKSAWFCKEVSSRDGVTCELALCPSTLWPYVYAGVDWVALIVEDEEELELGFSDALERLCVAAMLIARCDLGFLGAMASPDKIPEEVVGAMVLDAVNIVVRL